MTSFTGKAVAAREGENASESGQTSSEVTPQERSAAAITFDFKPLHIKQLDPIFIPGAGPVVDEDGYIKLFAHGVVINESFKPSWTSESVYGRMDPIAIFKNVERSISFNLKLYTTNITAQMSKADMHRLNLIIQSLYPVYTSHPTSQTILKSPPFHKLRYQGVVGNFSGGVSGNGLTGFITNFTTGLGDIATEFSVGAGGALLPNQYNTGFTFNVVHEDKVGWYDDGGVQKFGGGQGPGKNFPYLADEEMGPPAPEDQADGEETTDSSPTNAQNMTARAATMRMIG